MSNNPDYRIREELHGTVTSMIDAGWSYDRIKRETADVVIECREEQLVSDMSSRKKDFKL